MILNGRVGDGGWRILVSLLLERMAFPESKLWEAVLTKL